MSDRHLLALTQRLRTVLESDKWEQQGPVRALSADRYLDPERWHAERERIFGACPLIAAHHSELPQDAHWLAVSLAGREILLSRDENGRTRAFLNACRHRGMQLLEPGGRGCKTRISCPYHGWTYAADGRLLGLPHARAFPDLAMAERGLVELPCRLRHGFLWVAPRDGEPADIDRWLDTLGDDFQHLALDQHRIFAEGRSTVAANWKLCVDVFLEAYHVRILHRGTVGPFFEDALACSDAVGPHFRTAIARKPLREGQLEPLREAVSFAYFVFPNQIFVIHPDYVSQMSILPRDARSFDWHHRMLIPRALDTPELKQHWEKSFHLIEDGVFRSEDLGAAERIQRGLETGANPTVCLGQLEQLIGQFHDRLDAALAGQQLYPAVAEPAAKA